MILLCVLRGLLSARKFSKARGYGFETPYAHLGKSTDSEVRNCSVLLLCSYIGTLLSCVRSTRWPCFGFHSVGQFLSTACRSPRWVPSWCAVCCVEVLRHLLPVTVVHLRESEYDHGYSRFWRTLVAFRLFRPRVFEGQCWNYKLLRGSAESVSLLRCWSYGASWSKRWRFWVTFGRYRIRISAETRTLVKYCMVFLIPSSWIPWLHVRFGGDPVLPHPFQFIIHRRSCHSTQFIRSYWERR